MSFHPDTATGSPAQPDPDKDALIRILDEGLGDGPVFVSVLSSVDGGPDFADYTEAKDTDLVDTLLAWKNLAIAANQQDVALGAAPVEYFDAAEAEDVRTIRREMAIEAGDDSEFDRQIAEDDTRAERAAEAMRLAARENAAHDRTTCYECTDACTRCGNLNHHANDCEIEL